MPNTYTVVAVNVETAVTSKRKMHDYMFRGPFPF